jgi:hypothetical protein
MHGALLTLFTRLRVHISFGEMEKGCFGTKANSPLIKVAVASQMLLVILLFAVT